MAIPVIETERLVLRPLRTEDAEDLFEYAQDPVLARNGLWEPYEAIEECKKHLAQLISLYDKGLMWWAVEHREDGKMVGRMELSEHDQRDRRAELSYALNRDYWGQGFATEAARPVMEYGWNELHLHRVGATVDPANTASVKLLQKLGMQHEGRFRQYRHLAGDWVDVDVYAALASDVR